MDRRAVLIGKSINCHYCHSRLFGIFGDNCTVEAGLYITSGTKIHIIESDEKEINVIKAKEVSGHSNLLFYRDSLSGKVIAKRNHKTSSLNEELHKND